MDPSDTELAGLSGSDLVKRLRTSWRVADYEAAARIIDARDARLAGLEVALAETKERLDARDRELAESKEGLRARDAMLATAEVALAEAKESLRARDRELAKAKDGLLTRDRRLAKAEAELAEGLELRKLSLSLKEDLAVARAEQGALLEGLKVMREKCEALSAASSKPITEEDTLGMPRNGRAGACTADQGAHPGNIIAAPTPASCVLVEEKKAIFVSLCSSDEEEEDEQEGSWRDVSGVSRKRNVARSMCLSDDEDDELILKKKKKRDETQPEAVEEPKITDSVKSLGDFLPEESLMNKEKISEATVGGSDDPMVGTLAHRRGNLKPEENGGMTRTMPSVQQQLGSAVAQVNSSRHFGIDEMGISLPPSRPPGFPDQTGSLRNFSNADHSGQTIAGKEADTLGQVGNSLPLRPPGFPAQTGSLKNFSNADRSGPRIAGKEADTLVQVGNSNLSATKTMEFAQVGAVLKRHTNSSLGASVVLGLEAIREQEYL